MTSKSDADLLEAAWGIIANAYGGDWDNAQNKDWKPAAERWRDNYHEWLSNYVLDTPTEFVEEPTEFVEEFDK